MTGTAGTPGPALEIPALEIPALEIPALEIPALKIPALKIVVAAVMHDRAGALLLTRRPPGVHMAGLWELPGGKVEAGEAPADALVRELHEELGITATVGRPLTFAVHEEPGLRILLLFYEAQITDGRPQPLEGQELAWVAPERLADYPTPPADAELLGRLARRRPTDSR